MLGLEGSPSTSAADHSVVSQACFQLVCAKLKYSTITLKIALNIACSTYFTWQEQLQHPPTHGAAHNSSCLLVQSMAEESRVGRQASRQTLAADMRSVLVALWPAA
jgi:hypothetical protein